MKPFNLEQYQALVFSEGGKFGKLIVLVTPDIENNGEPFLQCCIGDDATEECGASLDSLWNESNDLPRGIYIAESYTCEDDPDCFGFRLIKEITELPAGDWRLVEESK